RQRRLREAVDVRPRRPTTHSAAATKERRPRAPCVLLHVVRNRFNGDERGEEEPDRAYNGEEEVNEAKRLAVHDLAIHDVGHSFCQLLVAADQNNFEDYFLRPQLSLERM
ncbi:hypothetical protein DQ04_01241190, partial [Trypanosoma grayi]|uniref:hypothetical protein n=1 Tax=Trypanosoma grayi TaxID=71804 RepID=UPI0004F463EE